MNWSILTGGQTGVDTGALMAARDLGIPWRVVFPQGMRREKKPPAWMLAGSWVELGWEGYDNRTKFCVCQSQAVLVYSHPFKETPGTKLTLDLCAHYRKPHMDITMNASAVGWKKTRDNVLSMLAPLGDCTIMIAGPRQSKFERAGEYGYTTTKYLLGPQSDFVIDLAD